MDEGGFVVLGVYQNDSGVRLNAKLEALPTGVYIVGGQKVMKR